MNYSYSAEEYDKAHRAPRNCAPTRSDAGVGADVGVVGGFVARFRCGRCQSDGADR
jgi:hypothetical protein